MSAEEQIQAFTTLVNRIEPHLIIDSTDWEEVITPALNGLGEAIAVYYGQSMPEPVTVMLQNTFSAIYCVGYARGKMWRPLIMTVAERQGDIA